MKQLKLRKYQLVLSVSLFLALLGSSACTKKNVTIPVLAPIFGEMDDRYAYVPAMTYAFDLVNNRSDILKDYHLVPEFYDTVASIPKSLYQANKIIDVNGCADKNHPPVIIGPAFSKTTIATAHAIVLYFTLQYTYASTSPVLDRVYDFPYLVRTLPSTSVFSKGHAALMKSFGWKRVGIFYDHHIQDGIFNRITEDLIVKLRKANMTVAGVESADAGGSSLATPGKEIKERLERMKTADIKIFFAQFSRVGAFRVFCQAYQLGMFGKNYVWIVHAHASMVDQWITVKGEFPYVDEDCTEEQFKRISERMLYFQTQNWRQDGKRTFSGLTASEYNTYISRHAKGKWSAFNVHAYAFDTVWSMALTLNKSIPGLKAINSSLDNMLYKNIEQANLLKSNAYSVEFEGITGPMKLTFKQGRIGTLTLFQIRNKKSIEVANFLGTTEKLELNPFVVQDLWIDGRIPSDRSLQRTVLLNIPLALYIPVCTVAGLGIVLAIAVLFFNIYNRNERYIRKSAPLFNNLIILGIIMCLSTVAFFGYPVELGDMDKFLMMCRLRFWVLCLGFSLSFGSMFVKTWRVYKIFTNRKLKYSIDRLSNTSLIGMILAIVAVDIFILLLWKFLDPMEVKESSLGKQVDPDDPNSVLLYVIYTCYSSNEGRYLTAIYVLKGILLLYGLFLAYETRNVKFEHLNDSRMIGVCVYNVAVMSILGGLLRIILNDNYYKESYGITAICIIFPSLGTLVLIFLPKVVRFVKRDPTTSATETEISDGVVIEGPAARNGNNFHLRKDSVCSEGVTSVSSSIPCSASRVMPIYEEATASTPNGCNCARDSTA